MPHTGAEAGAVGRRRATRVHEPITEPDEAIAQALRSAAVAPLLASLVHLTGDESLLRGPIRPAPASIASIRGGDGDDREQREAARAMALAALAAYRDRGCTLPPPPSPATIREMMAFVVGEPVPPEYAPMMIEELAFDGGEARRAGLGDGIPAERRERLRVLVVGAGMSGILMAIRLREAGIPHLVVEKNDGVGGTWYENTYPGCRVDVANHFYCYSFAGSADWSEFYCRQPELRRYFEDCTDRFGVRPNLRLGTEVLAATWDDDGATWRVHLRDRSGREEVVEANVVISAVGQLNRPRLPDIPGLDAFAGPAFHSAAWRHDVDLAGRRVAVVGTGASAFQLVPEVARIAGHLDVYQRSPAWMSPNPGYRRAVSEGKKWLLRHVPFYDRWYRFLCFWPASDGLMPTLEVDPAWPHPERSVNARNEQVRIALTAHLRSQVGDDAELLRKVVPTYPPFGKRMLQDDGGWIAALRRPNVELVTAPIARIEPDAIAGADGSRRPADAIVLATGFHATRFLWPIDVVGRGGARLAETWGDEPRAHLGITVPGFPNLFLLYGPGTNLAHAGSIIFHSECQARYVAGCLQQMLERGTAAVECRAEACADYNRRLDERLARLVWSHPAVTNWYRNPRGRVVTTSPWRLVDYWGWTRRPDPADFSWRPGAVT